jgi:DNA repair protein RadC
MTTPTLFHVPPLYELPKLKTLPLREQPAYRVSQNVSACSQIELLAAVIGGPKQIEIAEALLAHFQGDPSTGSGQVLHRIYQAHVTEIANVHGIGQNTAARIKAALNLGLRLSLPIEERPTINSPGDAAALVQPEMSMLETEHLRVILLDTRNHVLDIVDVYQGSVNSSQVRVGEVFKQAVRRNSAAVIICHNHPSGDPTPSPDDVAVTRAFVQAGKLLDTETLDHLVIGKNRFVSMKERGLGFS